MCWLLITCTIDMMNLSYLQFFIVNIDCVIWRKCGQKKSMSLPYFICHDFSELVQRILTAGNIQNDSLDKTILKMCILNAFTLAPCI